MLSDEQLDAMQRQYRKISRMLWDGHEFVFRKPTVPEYEAYQRQMGDPQSKHAALKQLSQVLLVYYDGDTSMPGARIAYTNGLIEDNPGFPNSPECAAALMYLAGTAQEEELAHLKKVVTCNGPRTASMRVASPNGSPTAHAGPSLAQMAPPLPSGQPSS